MQDLIINKRKSSVKINVSANTIHLLFLFVQHTLQTEILSIFWAHFLFPYSSTSVYMIFSF